MKKLIGIFSIALVIFTSSIVKAQTGLTPLYLQGNGTNFTIPSPIALHDTLVKSTTYFWVAPASNGSFNSDVSFTYALDSVSGAPAATATPYVSNDGVHWTSVGSAIVFASAPKTWHGSSTVPGVSDTCVTVNTNPWTGKYWGLKIVTTSATQKSLLKLTVKSFSTY